MLLLNKTILILFLLLSTAHAVEDQTDILNDTSSKESISTLNDNLRKTSRRLRDIENGIDINTGTTGILTTNRGGTGKDFSTVPKNSLIYFSDVGVMSNVGIGTTGYIFTSQGSTNPPAWTPGGTSYTAGDILIAGPSDLVSGNNASMTKSIELIVQRSGTLRIKITSIWPIGGGTTYQIYRNGVAVGTSRNSALIDQSEDIGGWVKGDLLQLYSYNSFDPGGLNNGGCVGFVKVYELTPGTSEIYTQGGHVNHSSVDVYNDSCTNAVPNTSVGNVGDLWINHSGGASTTLYVKTGISTWTAK